MSALTHCLKPKPTKLPNPKARTPIPCLKATTSTGIQNLKPNDPNLKAETTSYHPVGLSMADASSNSWNICGAGASTDAKLTTAEGFPGLNECAA